MSNWRYRLVQFMQGRYGMDGFNRFLMWTSLIVVFLSNFPRMHFLYLVGIAMLLFLYFRIMSRNIPARQRENQKFFDLTFGWRSKFAQMRARGQQSRDYAFYKCKNCGQTVRVPKGKGKIKITCPTCHSSFIKNTH